MKNHAGYLRHPRYDSTVRGILLLTSRYLTANKLKTAILLVCLTATFFLPLALKFLIARFEEDLLARGQTKKKEEATA